MSPVTDSLHELMLLILSLVAGRFMNMALINTSIEVNVNQLVYLYLSTRVLSHYCV